MARNKSNNPIPNDASKEARQAAQVRTINTVANADGSLTITVPAGWDTLPGVISGSGKSAVTVTARADVNGHTFMVTGYRKL